MITFGSKKVKLFVGTQKVKAAYVGTTKVYPNSSLALSASVLNFAAAGGQAALSILVEDGQAWSLTGVPAGWSVSATSGTGTGTVTITAPNNTTTAAVAGTLTVTSEELSAVCALAQAANAITYGSTFVLVNGSQATSAALSFGNSAQTLAVSLRQRQNCSYTSGAAGVVDTSQKPSVVSSSGYFTVADTTTYNGNATVPEYSFSITAAANSSSSTRSATVTFTFPNGDVVTVSCSQKGVSMAYQYLNVVADSNTVSNGSVSQLVVAWGTSSGSYSSSKTLTGSEISTTAQQISLSRVAAGTTIYFKFTGSVTASRLGAVAFSASGGLTLSGTTSYNMAGNVEFYGQMAVGSGGSYTGVLNIATSSGLL